MSLGCTTFHSMDCSPVKMKGRMGPHQKSIEGNSANHNDKADTIGKILLVLSFPMDLLCPGDPPPSAGIHTPRRSSARPISYD